MSKKHFTIAASKEHQQKLIDLAKKHKLTQGEILEVLLDNIGSPVSQLDEIFLAKRVEKLQARGTTGAIAELVKMGSQSWQTTKI